MDDSPELILPPHDLDAISMKSLHTPTILCFLSFFLVFPMQIAGQSTLEEERREPTANGGRFTSTTDPSNSQTTQSGILTAPGTVESSQLDGDAELNRIVDSLFLARQRSDSERDALVEAIHSYISSNPGSPYEAELYYRAGSLFSNSRLNLAHDDDRTLDYFRRSAAIYGDSYSLPNNTIKIFLANFPGEHDRRVELYRWLQRVENGELTPDDIYPIQSLSSLSFGLEANYSDAIKAKWVLSWKNRVESTLPHTEDWLIRLSSLVELNDFIEQFPGSRLAEKATEKSLGAKSRVVDIDSSESNSSFGKEAPAVTLSDEGRAASNVTLQRNYDRALPSQHENFLATPQASTQLFPWLILTGSFVFGFGLLLVCKRFLARSSE